MSESETPRMTYCLKRTDYLHEDAIALGFELERELNEAKAELAKVRETCKWVKAGMGFYESTCNIHNPFTQLPSSWVYCPLCGKRIEEVK